MTYDLRTESWLPFRRLSGAVEWGPPSLVADSLDRDPVVGIASPRPDFDGALTEFLIGLLAVAYQLEEESAWRELWSKPPSIDALHAKLLQLPSAFDMSGEGPRFLQDHSPEDLADAELAPPQELLIEGKNSALFIKPETVRQIGLPAAAMALITVQTYSPAGGRGYRTSLRGGGPLTTVVDPRTHASAESPIHLSLWRLLWANVPTLPDIFGDSVAHRRKSGPEAIFPWLAPTRTSEDDRGTTPADVSPFQCFFGMPRRIRLEFSSQPGVCDLTGMTHEHLVTGFRVRGNGVKYVGWRHPLSPYYAGKKSNDWLPVHAQPGGIGWRDWYALLQRTSDESRTPAKVIATFNDRRADRVGRRRYNLWAFGFDVANAKTRAWVDARLPAFAEPDGKRLAAIDALITSLTDATELSAYVLHKSVLQSLYAGSDDPPGDLSLIKAALWDRTAGAFYAGVFRALEAPDATPAAAEIRNEFQQSLLAEACEIFDTYVDPDPSHPAQLRRSVAARFSLVMTLRGGGKMGEKLFAALGLSTPKAKRVNAKTKRRIQEAEA